jgi:hypothetical protein
MSDEHDDDLMPSLLQRRAIVSDDADLPEELEDFNVTEQEIEAGRDEADDDGLDDDGIAGI